MTIKVEAEIEALTRKMLEERLSQLTDGQRAKFNLIYPNIGKENMISAIDLCDRTIRANAKNPSRLKNQEQQK